MNIQSGKQYRYDAFLSYRHEEPDSSFAIEICRRLEALGLRISIDFNNFSSNKKFLEETERCIKESQYTLIVASGKFFSSGNTLEEAIICKVLDMEESSHRLVPLKIEKCEMPLWVHNITGIDFTADQPNPYDKLVELFYSETRQAEFGGGVGLEKNIKGDRLVSKVKAKEILSLAIGGGASAAVLFELTKNEPNDYSDSESIADDIVEDSLVEGSKRVLGRIADWL